MRPSLKQGNLPPDVLWQVGNSQLNSSRLANFVQFIEERFAVAFTRAADGGLCAKTYSDLHNWSVQNVTDFWNALWDFCDVIGEKGDVILEEIPHVPWARFFPQGHVSYAENMLSYWLENPDEIAVIYRHQDGTDRILSGAEYCALVSRWEQALRASGLEEGECIGVYLTNVIETDIVLLAASNIGAVFCSAGMEVGGDDLIARFSAAQPKILVSASGYVYGAKRIDRSDVLARAEAEIQSIEHIILLPDEDFIAGFEAKPLKFKRWAFNHPLYILFSSGTTGEPKCFVHGTGGALLKHLEEYALQCDVRAGDCLFFHATPSWMMWNWAASALASGATLLKYDGAPFYPDALVQWRFTASHGCTHHGTAAPVILGWRDQGVDAQEAGLAMPELRAVIYTGAVLPEAGFHYLQAHIKQDIQIAGISGGTDLVGSFLGGNIFAPVYAGQMPCAMLGMDVQIWDEDGASVLEGEAGELVCVSPFPTMPLC